MRGKPRAFATAMRVERRKTVLIVVAENDNETTQPDMCRLGEVDGGSIAVVLDSWSASGAPPLLNGQAGTDESDRSRLSSDAILRHLAH
jgi:hypothetical protein